MKTLIVSDDPQEEIIEQFEDVEVVGVEQLAPEVIDRNITVRINGFTVEDFDAAYLELPQKNPIFGRVVIEIMEEKGLIPLYPSIGFFIMSKKNYLFYVLHQKNVPCPSTAIVASKKAVRNLNKELDFPIIARRYEDMSLMESKMIENEDEVKEFVEGVEYEDELLIFQNYTEGDKYRVMYADGQIISLQDRTDGWRVSNDYLQYSSLGTENKETVEKAVKAIGTNYAEVLLNDGKVVDINPNPDPDVYTDISGKNAFEATAQVLKNED